MSTAKSADGGAPARSFFALQNSPFQLILDSRYPVTVLTLWQTKNRDSDAALVSPGFVFPQGTILSAPNPLHNVTI
jgi:hypothetical protein